MTDPAVLHTLAADARHEIEVKRSRFLALAARCDTPEQALDWLASVSDPAATHNCWAYRIGSAYRFNDDGEPGGTAGRPILAAIDGQGVDHVAVVVIRWYGGTKLGAGGLARAYGGSAAECLRLAPREDVVRREAMRLRVGFEHEAAARRLVEQLDGVVGEVRYAADGIELAIELAADRREALRSGVDELTRGVGEVVSGAG